MDSFASYTDRIIQITPTILGLKLLPLNLGHLLLLRNANSVFIAGGIDGLKDLELIREIIFALLVCSTTYDNFNAELQSGEIAELIKEYVQNIRSGITNSGKSGKEAMDFMAEQIGLFLNYFQNGCTAPKLIALKSDSDTDFKPNPIDIEQAIMSTLMSKKGFTRTECLDLPFTETLSAYLLYAHEQGAIELMSREFYDLKAKLKNEQSKS